MRRFLRWFLTTDREYFLIKSFLIKVKNHAEKNHGFWTPYPKGVIYGHSKKIIHEHLWLIDGYLWPKNNIYICASLGIGVQPFHRTRMIKYPIYAIYIIGVGCAFFVWRGNFYKKLQCECGFTKKEHKNATP